LFVNYLFSCSSSHGYSTNQAHPATWFVSLQELNQIQEKRHSNVRAEAQDTYNKIPAAQTFEKLTDGSDRCNDSDNCSKSSALYLPLVDHWKLSPQHARQSWSKQFRVELFLCVEICKEMLIWWVMPMQTWILRICIVCIHDEMHKHVGLPLMCISEVSRESCLLCSHKSKWRTDGA
jgi:hypothetical protein